MEPDLRALAGRLRRWASAVEYTGGDMGKVRDLEAAARTLDALHEIANDGCGCGSPPCYERLPDRGEWCWSCMATAALRGEEESNG